MWHASCEICGRSQFDPAEVLAYTVRDREPEVIELRGRDPWSGVRVICKQCCRWIAIENPFPKKGPS